MGRVEEQMVAARESRASSKSEAAASHNILSVVLTSSSFFISYSRNENIQLLHSLGKEGITLCHKNAVCKELAFLSGWESHVPFQCSAHH